MSSLINARQRLQYIAERWISLWCASPDMALFDAIHAEEFEDCSPAGRCNTKAAFRAALIDICCAFPDLRTTVEDLVIDELRQIVAVRWLAIGTSRGPFLGRNPTGFVTRITGIDIIEIDHDKIVRRWGEWDASDIVSPKP